MLFEVSEVNFINLRYVMWIDIVPDGTKKNVCIGMQDGISYNKEFDTFEQAYNYVSTLAHSIREWV